MLGIDDLDIVRHLDVGRGDRAFAFLADDQRDFVTVVQAEHHALQVQHDVDDVFLHAVDRRVFVQHTGDRHFGRRITDHRRQQHTPQRVAQRMPIAALEWLEGDLGPVFAERFDLDGFGFEQIRLHEVFLSIPSVRYTDKAEGPASRGMLCTPRAGDHKQSQWRRVATRHRRIHSRISVNTTRRSALP